MLKLFKSPEGTKFRSGKELENYFKRINSSYNYQDFGFSRTLYKVKDDIPKVPQTNPVEKKKKNRCLKVKENQKSSCSSTRNSAFIEALNDALKITKGWTRKTIQRQSGKTAGVWDVYIYK